MRALHSLKARAGMLAAGLASFLVLLAAMRLSSGEPLLQPSGDIGVVIGFALVALYFVLSDRAPSSRQGRSGAYNGIL